MGKFGKKDNKWFLSEDGKYHESQFAPWDSKRDVEDLPNFIDNPAIGLAFISGTEAIAMYYGEYNDVERTIMAETNAEIENCIYHDVSIRVLLLPEDISIEDANRCINDRKFLAELYLKNKENEKEEARSNDLFSKLLDKVYGKPERKKKREKKKRTELSGKEDPEQNYIRSISE